MKTICNHKYTFKDSFACKNHDHIYEIFTYSTDDLKDFYFVNYKETGIRDHKTKEVNDVVTEDMIIYTPSFTYSWTEQELEKFLYHEVAKVVSFLHRDCDI